MEIIGHYLEKAKVEVTCDDTNLNQFKLQKISEPASEDEWKREYLILQIVENNKTLKRVISKFKQSTGVRVLSEQLGTTKVNEFFSNAKVKNDLKGFLNEIDKESIISTLTEDTLEECISHCISSPDKDDKDDPWVQVLTSSCWMVTNIVIYAANCLFKSVLEAEYLEDDKFSKDQLKEYDNRIQDYRKWANEKEGKTEREIDEILEIEPNRNRLIWTRTLHRAIDDYQYLCCRLNLLVRPGRNIRFSSPNDELDITKYQLFDDYYYRFKSKGINGLNIWRLDEIVPYLFKELIEISWIDHHFLIGEKEISTLLRYEDALTKAIEILEEFEKIKSDDNKLVSRKIIKDFRETLCYVKVKNNFLIWKIIKSDRKHSDDGKYLLSRQLFYINGDSIIFLGKEGEQSELVSSKRCKHKNEESYSLTAKYNDNDAADMFQSAYCRDPNIFQAQDKFRDYEHQILLAKYDKSLDDLDSYKQKVKDTKKLLINNNTTAIVHSADVHQYNNQIITNFDHHFDELGYWVKRLKFLKTAEEEEEYISDLENYLIRNSSQGFSYSFSFLHRTIDWLSNYLRGITDQIKNSGLGIDGITKRRLNTGSKCAAILSQLTIESDKLLIAIEEEGYRLAYVSLFKDCFFIATLNPEDPKNKDTNPPPLSCLIRLSEANKSGETEEGTQPIFIASSWREPFGKRFVKEMLDKDKYESQNIVEQFHNTSIDHSTREANEIVRKNMDQEKRFSDEIDSTKRSMVQTLSIFAALISIVTVALGSTELNNPIDTVKMILSVTLCLAVFVVLLNYVIGSTQKSSLRRVLSRVVIIGVIVLLSVLLIIVIR